MSDTQSSVRGLALLADLPEDQAVRALRVLAAEARRKGVPFALEDFIQGCPRLTERSALFDAAVQESLEGAVMLLGLTPERASEIVVGRHPEHSEAIARAAVAITRTKQSARRDPVSMPFRLGEGEDIRFEMDRAERHDEWGWLYAGFELLPDGSRGRAVCARVFDDASDDEPVAMLRRCETVRHSVLCGLLSVDVHPELGLFLVFDRSMTDGLGIASYAGSITDTAGLRLGRNLADALQSVHAAGLSHGAIRPGSLLMNAEGRVRLCDLGTALARPMHTDPESGDLLVHSFRAPETVLSAEGSGGVASDIFETCGVVFWLLTGRPPHGESYEEVFGSIRGDRAMLDRRALLLEGLPSDIEAVLQRGLSHDPSQRQRDAATLAMEFQICLKKLGASESNQPDLDRASRTPMLVQMLLMIVGSVVGAAAVGLPLNARMDRVESQAEMAEGERAAAVDNLAVRDAQTQSWLEMMESTRPGGSGESGESGVRTLGSASDRLNALRGAREWLGFSDRSVPLLDEIEIDLIRERLESLAAHGRSTGLDLSLGRIGIALTLLRLERDTDAAAELRAAAGLVEELIPSETAWVSSLRALAALADAMASGTPVPEMPDDLTDWAESAWRVRLDDGDV